jgi:hypothetical protein
MYRHQNAGQNHNIQIVNKKFRNCDNIKTFGMTNQNYVEQIKFRELFIPF